MALEMVVLLVLWLVVLSISANSTICSSTIQLLNSASFCGPYPMLRARCVTAVVSGVGSVIGDVRRVVGIQMCIVCSGSVT